jgi:hypothetical protein
MSGVPANESEGVANSGGYGRVRHKWNGKWSHLPADKQEQYKAIEARVQEKVDKGLL